MTRGALTTRASESSFVSDADTDADTTASTDAAESDAGLLPLSLSREISNVSAVSDASSPSSAGHASSPSERRKRRLSNLCSTPSTAPIYEDSLRSHTSRPDLVLRSAIPYLSVASLARLRAVSKFFKAKLAEDAAIWHRCARRGGVPPSVRGDFWLWAMYKRSFESVRAKGR